MSTLDADASMVLAKAPAVEVTVLSRDTMVLEVERAMVDMNVAPGCDGDQIKKARSAGGCDPGVRSVTRGGT